MTTESRFMNTLLDKLVELLDIPPSYYELARGRYQSLGRWLHRPESSVRDFSPDVFPQGSFRYGTVIRPLLGGEEYDLDLVCRLLMTKGGVTQAYLKDLMGREIKAYAEAHAFNDPAEEKPRCWRLNYADGVSFHMDILPCIPEDTAFVERLIALGVPRHLAAEAVAITDIRHDNYRRIASIWPSSNPRGLALSFEERMKPVARTKIAALVENRKYASIDDVPAFEWKTPLQRSIQILKRHRDVMFRDQPDWKPLSMIITTLAAHAYGGEADLYEALSGIVSRMDDYIRPERPRVPNPVNPAEDFADRWAKDQRYEQNFRAWLAQAQADVAALPRLLGKTPQVVDALRRKFAVTLPQDAQDDLQSLAPAVIVPVSRAVQIAAAPKPWAQYG